MSAPVPTTVVFCGPSIRADEVRAALTAALGSDPGDALVTLPPATQGDVIAAVRRYRPHTVVLIDGLFERVPAVWHKELLWAMDAGIHTFGSSSMGALRAAELHPFGMVGVGRVFEQFRAGELTDDDEVAVVHSTADEGFRPLSTAMVDLRDHITSAADAGLLDATQAAHLVRTAKALAYPHRAMPAVLRLAQEATDPPASALDAAAIAWLTAAAQDRACSRKHLDAQDCLRRVAAHLVATPGPFRPDGWYVEPTMFLTSAIHEVDQSLHVTTTPTDGDHPDGGEAAPGDGRVDIGLVGEAPAVLRKQALLRILARDLASVRGIRLDDEDIESVIANFRQRYALDDTESFERWLDQHGLTWPQVASALTDIALVDRVERAYRAQVDAAVAPLAQFGAARRATDERPSPPTPPPEPSPPRSP